jgi:hypothetical protein
VKRRISGTESNLESRGGRRRLAFVSLIAKGAVSQEREREYHEDSRGKLN